MCADMLHAIALGTEFSSLALISPLISYASILNMEKYEPKYIMSAVAGSNSVYDLPHLTHYAPKNLIIYDPVDARGNKIDREQALSEYQKYRRNPFELIVTSKALGIRREILNYFR